MSENEKIYTEDEYITAVYIIELVSAYGNESDRSQFEFKSAIRTKIIYERQQREREKATSQTRDYSPLPFGYAVSMQDFMKPAIVVNPFAREYKAKFEAPDQKPKLEVEYPYSTNLKQCVLKFEEYLVKRTTKCADAGDTEKQRVFSLVLGEFSNVTKVARHDG